MEHSALGLPALLPLGGVFAIQVLARATMSKLFFTSRPREFPIPLVRDLHACEVFPFM
jgi:hypothetical protein